MSGVCRNNKDRIIVLIQTDLPDPVVPAISKWGIEDKSPTTGAPDTLDYQCGNHSAMYGILQIRDITTTRKIDPEKDIIGTRNYSLRTLDLSNGMKIKFKNDKSLIYIFLH